MDKKEIVMNVTKDLIIALQKAKNNPLNLPLKSGTNLIDPFAEHFDYLAKKMAETYDGLN